MSLAILYPGREAARLCLTCGSRGGVDCGHVYCPNNVVEAAPASTYQPKEGESNVEPQ